MNEEFSPMNAVKIYFDGGSRGNPGPAAGAAFADYENGHERACYLQSATNNEAEYRGLIMAIELALELKLTRVEFLGDSKLVVMQILGEWQAKHAVMSELRLLALQALCRLPAWRIQWIPRDQNTEADRIANEEMDRQLGIEPRISLDPVAAPTTLSGQQVPSAAAIARLNSLGAKAGFRDILKLKVGGKDALSRSSLTVLATLLSNFNELEEAFQARLRVDQLTRDLDDNARKKLLLQALRWSARGLEAELSLRKVFVDLEVSTSMRGKRK